MFYSKLNLSHARKLFVVGDIHGMFTLLDEKLAALGFDYEQDHLLSVGDLIDRGPESHRAVEYVSKPWFHFVRGNHEQLAQAHLMGQARHHIDNGGEWFTKLSPDDQKEHARILNDAPVVLEVETPTGRRIGLIHADFPTRDWADLYGLEEAFYDQWTSYCLWNRSGIREMGIDGIRNIDHVYFGHTPLRSVYRMGNCSWIDTAACYDGDLTILEVK